MHRVGWAGMFAVIRQFQALDAKCSTVDHDNQEALLAAGVNVGDVSLMLDTCIDANANVSVPSRHSTPLPSVAPATEVSWHRCGKVLFCREALPRLLTISLPVCVCAAAVQCGHHNLRLIRSLGPVLWHCAVPERSARSGAGGDVGIQTGHDFVPGDWCLAGPGVAVTCMRVFACVVLATLKHDVAVTGAASSGTFPYC